MINSPREITTSERRADDKPAGGICQQIFSQRRRASPTGVPGVTAAAAEFPSANIIKESEILTTVVALTNKLL